ncbi:PAS domain S-box protein [Pararoseomonas sp. SCSIO 73927]|uniref:PAS domain S-box protein n=1 Tax=Pararoseomonas sp. SCSIO 73927 TaxID=3114537 RepID=UPI0030D216A0
MFEQPFGQVLSNEAGRFLQVNRTVCELLRMDAQVLLTRSIRDITHPADWSDNSALLHRLRHGGEAFTIVKRYLRGDGTIVWVQNYVSLLYDAAGGSTLNALIRPVLPETAGHQGMVLRSESSLH